MRRQPLLNKLRNHQPFDDQERVMCQALIEFVEGHLSCFERSLLIGHVTGSAWVLDYTRSQTLLTHHRKLDRWLQLGGHADGEPDILEVALREAVEESGLADIRPVSGEIFDVDIHEIPATPKEPRHYHYDVRMLLEADSRAQLVVSGESKNLAWVRLVDVPRYSSDPSILRMLRKTERLY